MAGLGALEELRALDADADALLRRIGEEVARRWASGAPGPLGREGSSREEIVSKRELCSLVRDIVKELPQTERTVVEGYFFGERNLKEVGAMAGASESWACRKLARGVRKVRRKLQERGVEFNARTVRESRE